MASCAGVVMGRHGFACQGSYGSAWLRLPGTIAARAVMVPVLPHAPNSSCSQFNRAEINAFPHIHAAAQVRFEPGTVSARAV